MLDTVGGAAVDDTARDVDDGKPQRLQLAAHGAKVRHGSKQSARIGMLRVGKHAAGLAILHFATLPHDDHSIRDLGDHPHIVRDEEDGHALFVLQGLDELEDLRLDCHVECGRGLIRNEQLGPARQRHGDHHALAHSAGKAVRILVHPLARGRDAHPLQDAHGLCLRRATRQATVVDKSLRDLEPDREHRIEARHRLLEDHGDAVASDLAHLLFRQIEQALTLERDSALNAAVHRRYQLHDGQRGDALARARLAHDGHCLARPDLEADVVDHRAPLAVDPERGRKT